MARKIDGSANARAYETVEAISNFSSYEEIVEYRRRRIERYSAAANFIATRSETSSSKLSVVEVGSGSSALLYAIEQKGILENALGIELSKSRYEFAEKWRADECYKVVRNLNQDFASVDLAPGSFDWFIVIDNTFTYLSPEDATYPVQLLRRASAALRTGGRVLLDFINYASRKYEMASRNWHEFPLLDPFRYGLYQTEIVDGICITESRFVRRDGGEESRKLELSKVYSLADIRELLADCGFRVCEVFAGFGGEVYHPESSERLLVVAAKDEGVRPSQT